MSSVKQHPAPPTRALRKKEKTRQAILDAARRIAAQEGAGGMTVAAIADEADIGVGTFYYHFPARDDVLAALMDELLQTLSREIAEFPDAELGLFDRIKARLTTFLTLALQERELFRVYFASAAAREEFAEAARQYFLDDTHTLIQQGQKSGEFRKGDVELLAHWLFAASQGALQELIQRDGDFVPDEVATVIAELSYGALAVRKS